MFAAGWNVPPRSMAAGAIAALLPWFAQTSLADERVCHASAIEGGGAALWNGGTWAPLSGAALPAGESKIVTDGESRVEVTCSDGITLTIAPGTEVNLEELTAVAVPQAGIVLQLIEGIVGLVAPERSFRRFEIRTPLAIASVRSTDWAVIHRDGASAVFTRAGEVVVRTLGQPVVLRQGEGIDIAASGLPGPVRQWGAPRVAELNEALGFAWR